MYIFNIEQVYLYGRKVTRTEGGKCRNCALYTTCTLYNIKNFNAKWPPYVCFDPDVFVGYYFQEI